VLKYDLFWFNEYALHKMYLLKREKNTVMLLDHFLLLFKNSFNPKEASGRYHCLWCCICQKTKTTTIK